MALTALPGSSLGPAAGRGPALAPAGVCYWPRGGTIITYVTYVRNVRYICADQDMINIRYLASMPDDAINPYADEPLYVQLAGIIRRMIQSGQLQHLDPVPSESSLGQAYGVSRDTVRRTMALLRDEGIVFTVPHRGTYVGPRPK
jgi:GntR family transcriptional regulator